MPCRDHKKRKLICFLFFVVPFSPSPQKRRPPVGHATFVLAKVGAFVASIFFENQRAGRDPASTAAVFGERIVHKCVALRPEKGKK